MSHTQVKETYCRELFRTKQLPHKPTNFRKSRSHSTLLLSYPLFMLVKIELTLHNFSFFLFFVYKQNSIGSNLHAKFDMPMKLNLGVRFLSTAEFNQHSLCILFRFNSITIQYAIHQTSLLISRICYPSLIQRIVWHITCEDSSKEQQLLPDHH